LRFHPGANEIEWLAELKTRAEQIGAEVFGRPILWRVETGITRSRDRSDVVIQFENGSIIATGEAKRPDDPQGVSPILADEVDNAVKKAQAQGAKWCFTTNFHQIAVFDAGPGLMARPLSRLQGSLIDFVSAKHASSIGWWSILSEEQRTEATSLGLRSLFERCRLLLEGQHPRVPVDVVVVDFFSQITFQLLEPTWRQFLNSPFRSSPELRQRASSAGLNPSLDQEARYLIAQGIFEVLSASLFYRVLQDHFAELGPLLAGTDPQNARTLERVITDSLQDAQAHSGDYETILQLTVLGKWVLSSTLSEAIPHWRALLAFIDRLDVSEISSDVLGSIFERLISPERRHEMGQHYTQPRLARSMAKWGVVDKNSVVLDPSCGAGSFLVETYAQHRALGLTHDQILTQTFGNDLDSFGVHLAAINLVTKRIRHGINHPLLRLGDAFDLRPGISMLTVHPFGESEQELFLKPVDLIIANPPYGRAHPDPITALDKLRKMFSPNERLPETSGINFGAWFVILGAGLAKENGRMAFVLQSGILQNENLANWRQWVRKRWDIVIWHTEDDVWFSDARVATCVILFSPRPKSAKGFGNAQFVNVMEPASGDLAHHAGVPVPASRVRVRDISWTQASDDLLVAGTKPEALIEFEKAAYVSTIKELKGIIVGAGQKLGHDFFKLKDLDPDHSGVLREVTGLGASFKINRSHLTPILSGPKEMKSGEPALQQNWLLTLGNKLPASKAVQQYIELGKSQAVHEAPSVKSRGKAWWSIAPKLWNIAVPMSSQFRHELAWLAPAGAVTNNFNAIRADNEADALLIAASLASAFGALSRLYISGEVGCEGARRLLLTQFIQWPVLAPGEIKDAKLRAACLTCYEQWRRISPSEIDEMPAAELAVWRELTIAVAQAGLGPSAPLEKAVRMADTAINEARATVARRRRRETLAIGGRTRQSGARNTGLSNRVRRWVGTVPAYSQTTDLLTSGPSVYALRSLGETHLLGLFGEETPLAATPASEQALINYLGSGFTAAWPDPSSQSKELASLVDLVSTLFESATTTMIGEAPDPNSPALLTWNELANEVRLLLRRQLQSAVREALS
jgi:hypothetical protein